MTAASGCTRALLALVGLGYLFLPAAAGADAHEVDQAEVCLDCHDEVAAEMALSVKHSPAEEAECSSCHNPHAARNAWLLLDRPAILCAECHGEIADELRRPVLHEPVAEGRCTDCHEPHGGAHEGLLAGAGADLCMTCHEVIAEWQARSRQHSPFQRGRCADCHEPHGSEHQGLATKPGGEACAKCHPVSAKFRADHGGYPVQNFGCQQCHDPHSSDQRGLMQERVHAAFEDGDCGTCHVSAGSPSPFGLRTTENRLCGECHEDQVEENLSAAFPHVSAGGSECSSCHNPHAGRDQGLLHRGLNDLCLSCHDPGGSSSGLPGRFQSHSDLSCDTCHNPHGSDRPLLLADEPTELCSVCHSHQHAITHPLGEEILDPRTGQAMDCLSCHGLHEAPHENYLYRDGSRELCIGCHKSKGAPR